MIAGRRFLVHLIGSIQKLSMETKMNPQQETQDPKPFWYTCKCLAYASVFTMIYLIGKFVTSL